MCFIEKIQKQSGRKNNSGNRTITELTMIFHEPDDKNIEHWAFEAFSHAHPHEAYAAFPERFWNFFHKKCPNVTRERMEELLKETEHETKETNS